MLSFLVLAAPLSGCLLWGDDAEPEVQPEEEPGFGAFSVVAPIDTGISIFPSWAAYFSLCGQWASGPFS